MGQKSRWQLPTTVHPTKYRRFVVCVPDEKFYIAAFQGLLIELTYSKNWQRDSAHTAASVSRLWETILASVTCEQECAQAIQEMDYQMSVCEQLRINEGKLQGFCCGKWVDIDGQDGKTLYGPGQDGGGTPQPTAGGDCQTYHAVFDAKSLYLLPTVVSSGDTLEFSNPKGSGYDGAFGHTWNCPNGQTFFAGGCIGIGGPAGGDPAPSLNHMALIVEIAGVYYNAYEGTITVPGGVSNAQATLQANDSNIADNSGSYSVDVKVCNNAVANWVHTFNLELETGGFVVNASGEGTWTAGIGWTSQYDSTPPGSDEVFIKRTVPAGTYTTVTIEWTATHAGTLYVGTPTIYDTVVITAGSGTHVWAGPLVTGDEIDYEILETTIGSGAHFVLTSIEFHGTGTDPF